MYTKRILQCVQGCVVKLSVVRTPYYLQEEWNIPSVQSCFTTSCTSAFQNGLCRCCSCSSFLEFFMITSQTHCSIFMTVVLHSSTTRTEDTKTFVTLTDAHFTHSTFTKRTRHHLGGLFTEPALTEGISFGRWFKWLFSLVTLHHDFKCIVSGIWIIM